jgi:[protein-PII] uridylyltransferase
MGADSRSIDTIVNGAAARLATVPEGGARSEQVEALRRFLRLETERLRMRHRAGLGGDEITAGRSHQVDLAVRRVCQLVAGDFSALAQAELSEVALVALGGYGRGELAPFSDVDVLYLHSGRSAGAVREFVERTLALLWDTGFTVGHSFRTVEECVAIARTDLHSRTALAESRWLVGGERVLAGLHERLDEEVFRNRRETERFVAALRAETEGRLEKYGRSVGLLEPNVKQGAGGLRDLHTILWLGHARFQARSIEDLRNAAQLTPEEYGALRRARAFLSRVRNEAHFSAGRKADQLTLDLQPEVAGNLGYSVWRGSLASERLMRDYYQRAHEVHHVSERFLVRNGLYERRRGLRLPLPFRRGQERFEVHDGALHFRQGREGFSGDPLGMLAAFEFAQARGVDLGDAVRIAIHQSLASVDARFRSSGEASRAFLGILGRRGRVAPALRAMRDTGFLGRFVPEFARITFLVQHDQYHHYTVDEHTLKAVEALDEVAAERDRHGPLAEFRSHFDEVEDAAPLYLALLLHDSGKGRGGRHSHVGARIAERVCARLRIEGSAAEDVVFLVGRHLAMSQTSQRRDLSEEALIEKFAQEVGSLERLNQLLLLTYADNRGVGPNVWSAWKGALLFELYARARSLLTGKTTRLGDDWRLRSHAHIVEELAGLFPASQIERHLAMLPDRYLRTVRAPDLACHLRLVEKLAEERVVVEWLDGEARAHSSLTVCTRDAPGAFARLAGTMSANGLDILRVDVFTREDGIVLDTFTVREASGDGLVTEGRRARLEADLSAAVEGRLDVGRAVEEWQIRAARRPARRSARPGRPPGVHFDVNASPVATVVEVTAEDELGLAYRIASTLASLGLDITFAKIASEKSRAWDVFYVTSASGEKLSGEQMEEVRHALIEALSGRAEKTRKEASR